MRLIIILKKGIRINHFKQTYIRIGEISFKLGMPADGGPDRVFKDPIHSVS